jgi:hypothetical protein
MALSFSGNALRPLSADLSDCVIPGRLAERGITALPEFPHFAGFDHRAASALEGIGGYLFAATPGNGPEPGL